MIEEHSDTAENPFFCQKCNVYLKVIWRFPTYIAQRQLLSSFPLPNEAFSNEAFWKASFPMFWISKVGQTHLWHSRCMWFWHKSVYSNFLSLKHGKRGFLKCLVWDCLVSKQGVRLELPLGLDGYDLWDWNEYFEDGVFLHHIHTGLP